MSRAPLLDYGFPVQPVFDAGSRTQVDVVSLPTGEEVRVFVVAYGPNPHYAVRYYDGYFHHTNLTGPQMVYHIRERARSMQAKLDELHPPSPKS